MRLKPRKFGYLYMAAVSVEKVDSLNDLTLSLFPDTDRRLDRVYILSGHRLSNMEFIGTQVDTIMGMTHAKMFRDDIIMGIR